MNTQTDDRKQAVRYLLGDLAEAEQALIEERFFQDADFSELLSEVEDDLVDAYVRAEMPKADRERFERHYLSSPRRHDKVAFARSFLQLKTAGSPMLRRPWWPLRFPSNPRAVAYSFAAAAFVFLLGGVWFAFESARLRQEVAQLRGLEEQILQERRQLAQSEAVKDSLTKELERLRQQATNPDPRSMMPILGAFVLAPAVRNGGDSLRLSIPRGSGLVRLQVHPNPGDEYPTYRVELKTAQGKPVWSDAELKATAAGGETSVVVDVPAQLLFDGDYELALIGVRNSSRAENIGYYYFSLLKK